MDKQQKPDYDEIAEGGGYLKNFHKLDCPDLYRFCLAHKETTSELCGIYYSICQNEKISRLIGARSWWS